MITQDTDVICSNLLNRQFAFTFSTFIFLHNGTFKEATLLEYLVPCLCKGNVFQ